MKLSPRQAELVTLLEAGLTNRQIRERMHYSGQASVSEAIRHIREKGIDFADNRLPDPSGMGRPLGCAGCESWEDVSPRVMRARIDREVARGERCRHCWLLLDGPCDCPRAVRA